MRRSSLISVVVPNFNNAAYLEECLLSLMRQTHRDIEILVIDDASTDASVEIINRVAAQDPRLVPVFNKQNMGVAWSRNQAIMMSRGEYITTLDSDDVLLGEDKLERELECLLTQTAAERERCIIFSGIVLIDSNGKKLGAQHLTVMEGMLLHDIMRRSCLIPRDFLFTKKQYIEAGGYDPQIGIYEDWDLKIRLASRNKFFYSGVEGVGYRRHGQGLSAVSPLCHIQWMNRIFIKNIRLLKKNKVGVIGGFYKMLFRLCFGWGIANIKSRMGRFAGVHKN